jgi:hypothetical protein
MKKPKYKIGQRVYALWYGGRITSHIVIDIKEELYGYWYEWINAYDIGDHGKGEISGLYEKDLYGSFRGAEKQLENDNISE